MKICLENTVLVKIEKKSGILHADLTEFYCCQLHNFSVKHCCATLSTCLFLTVRCSSVLHVLFFFHCIVVTRKRHSLRYAYIAYLVVNNT